MPRAVLLPSLVLLTVACVLVAGVGTATAASPTPSPPVRIDPRGGASASLTGDPLLAAVVVVLIGAATALGTLAFLRVAAALGDRPHR